MGEIRCPRCGVSSPDSAQRCDCGYDFTTKTVQRSYIDSRSQMPSSTVGAATGGEDLPRVVVADVNMRFGSMVVFMLKWALASIPALIILVGLAALAVALLGGTLAGLLPALLRK